MSSCPAWCPPSLKLRRTGIEPVEALAQTAAGHPRLPCAPASKDVDGRAQASGSDAVLRTAMPGHDEQSSPGWRPQVAHSRDPLASRTYKNVQPEVRLEAPRHPVFLLTPHLAHAHTRSLICPSCQSAAAGIIDFTPKSNPYLHRLVPQRGGSRSSRTRGGMRWTLMRCKTNGA
jgi:hypothetical protein